MRLFDGQRAWVVQRVSALLLLLLSCSPGPCGPPSPPGTLGYIPFCCNDLCLPACPTILYKVTLVVG